MSDAAVRVDALLGDKKPRVRKVCALCGEPRTLQVTIRLGRVADNGTLQAGRSLTQSCVLCDECGVVAFETMQKAIGR